MSILPDSPPGRSGTRALTRRPLIAAVVGLLLLAAIGAVLVTRRGGGRHVGGTAATATTAASEKPRAWRVALHAVTQPAPAGNRFVVYAATGGVLQLVALDAATGRTAWTEPATTSDIAPGSAPIVTVVGGRVVFLQGVAGGATEIVAADAMTGHVSWRSKPGAFSGWPVVCPGDPTAICASGVLQSGPGSGVVRLDVASGRDLPSPQLGAPQARELAPDLFDAGQRNPEFIVATTATALSWKQPLHHIFTFPGASTDYGWNFDRDARAGVFVGSVGGPPLVETRSRYVSDLSQGATAAFRITDGRVLWRDPGTLYLCGYLACPGGSNPTYSSTATATSGGPTLSILLRAHGRLSGSPTALAPKASADATGVLEGVDPTTGRVRWRFDIGHDVGLLTQVTLPPRVGATKVLLQDAHHRATILDLATGSSVRAPATTRGWCDSIISYQLSAAYVAQGRQIHNYVGQYALSPCNPSGRTIAEPTSLDATSAGLLNGTPRIAAWTQQDAVVAMPLG